jgi:hypothetical protein
MVVRLIRLAVMGVICGAVVGCSEGGASLSPVTGKVTHNDKPVAGANVTFNPEQGAPATGVTDQQGEYKLNTGGRPGAVQGKHRVGITKFTGGGDTANPTPDDMVKMQKEGKLPTSKNELPAKYAAPQSSGLEATVTGDASKNVFNFGLKD